MLQIHPVKSHDQCEKLHWKIRHADIFWALDVFPVLKQQVNSLQGQSALAWLRTTDHMVCLCVRNQETRWFDEVGVFFQS